MVKRDELIEYIHSLLGHELLHTANKLDPNANGVQIHGNENVTKVALGVSTTLDFLNKAVDWGAEFTIAHHGLHLAGMYIYNARLDQAQQAILRRVFNANLTVSGYHASLDMQPEIGNNAVIIRELGAKRLDIPYFEGWGWIAEFDEPREVTELAKRCKKLFNNEVFTVLAGPSKVKRIGVCSGGAKPSGATLHEIYEQGIELHIAGEISHSGIHVAKECGFNYFAGGHYATEVFGVQELGKKLKAHYKDQLEVEFIDVPNPL